ncbi:AraC family transcriptional regulator [Paenibacillus radicis (ex Gao et al. 2016)]|uniref:Transcriptional regulator n=1 Tax=Paenibacillus radicis (ex Gao et al. 2016) TaxID=1737354 RepID=A0A917H7Y4_9BACL|nr:AraC family transcriptional regulator [Paenibacillus radicis (ex Gao et al. 2016)]GGG69985.1 transcriptional regulator [Paenibacillus radicis (ex Gao et al. 2016)]
MELMSIQSEHTAASPANASNKELITAETLRLANLISGLAPYDGFFSQRIPCLSVSRFSRVNKNDVKSFDLPSMLIVAQGAKTVIAGQEVYRFNQSQILMLPVALPIALKVTDASHFEPYLGVKLVIDPHKIAELALRVYPHGVPAVTKWNAGYVLDADAGMLNAASRLIECLNNKSDSDLLSPLIMDEILIRVLRSPIGSRIAELGFAGSEAHLVTKAVTWIRNNYSHPMKVAELAELAHMSESTFRVHFKSITSMSPLQYQKALRLHEARRLMISESMDATTACNLVGYASPSQFSRDYSRFFGNPPKKDVAALRQ